MYKYSALKKDFLLKNSLLDDIFKTLGISVFIYENKTKIVYEALKLVNFRKLKDNEESINLYAIKLLELFYPDKKEEFEKTPIDYFATKLLKTEKLLENKIRLEKEVKHDLLAVNNLIIDYKEI